MMKHAPVYQQDCIIYWPSYVGGVGIICMVDVTVLIFGLSALFLCGDNLATGQTKWIMAAVSVLVLIYALIVHILAYRTMFCCITVTREGFSITNRVTKKNTNILWGQVSEIKHIQEYYRGRKQYKIYLYSNGQEDCVALPISMVNEEKLHAFIPSELVTNKPYFV